MRGPSLLLLLLTQAAAPGCFKLAPDSGGDAPQQSPSSCRDDKQDNDETDVDCGGSCDGCTVGQMCRGGVDCQSGRCDAGRCAVVGSTCFDHIRDGRETDVDCGGGCAKCAEGKACVVARDCAGGACAQGVCGPGAGPFAFSPPRFANAGKGVAALAVADLDGDGRLDVATANAVSDDVSVLLGVGDGTFRDAVAVAAGKAPTWLGAVDLDGDRRLDLVVLTSGGDGGFSVLLGQGGGGFGAPTHFSAPDVDKPIDAAIADLDFDGRPDVLVSGGGRLTLFSGRGGGSFGSGVRLGGDGIAPAAITAADLDGDGLADVAVVSSILKVFHGRAFTEVDLTSGPSPDNVGAFDLRRSGHLDLVVAGLDGSIGVLLARGGASFAEPVFHEVGSQPFSVVAADFDGDGALDLAVGNQATTDISLLAGHGDGDFEAPINLWIGGSLQQLAAADMNGDGRPDLVLCDFWQHDVGVLLNVKK